MSVRHAFVTLLTSDSYLPGALILSGALKDVHQSLPPDQQVIYETVCLVTPHTLDITTIRLLRRAFNVVIGVEVIPQPDAQRLALLGRPDLDTVFTKLHVFRLTQYSKIIFLDADVLPVRPLSHLFGLDHEFAAVPDVGWPDVFNSGVMVLSPGEDRFNQIYDLLNTQGSWDGGDQGILNEWRGDNWHRLRFTYNTTPTAAYTYAPAYERFGSQISAIHFIGPNKPWHSLPYRTIGSSSTQTTTSMSEQTSSADTTPPYQRIYDYASLEDRWHDVYDRHYRSQSGVAKSDFQVPKCLSAWDERSNTDTSKRDSTGSIFSRNDLRHAALEGTNSLGTLSSIGATGEGEFRNMPLEGRFDLIRPLTRAERKQREHALPTPSSSQSTKVSSVIPSQSLEEPSTPVNQAVSLPSVPSVQRTILSTPDPNKFPSAPRTQLLSLPPTPLHNDALSYQPTPTREIAIATDSPQAGFVCLPTPPLLKQDAVTEPSSDYPLSSSFQTDTYFANDLLGPSTPSTSSAISATFGDMLETSVKISPLRFQCKLDTSHNPSTDVRHLLLRQSSYYNNSEEKGSSGPDRTQLKPIFPWEERPRRAPGRVFPSDDLPSPGTVSVYPFTATTVSSTPERMASGYLSALSSPFRDIFHNPPNTWDDMAGVRKNPSKLRPPVPPSPLAQSSAPVSKRSEKLLEADSEGVNVGDEIDTKDEGDNCVQLPGESVELATRQGVLYRSIGVDIDSKGV
ncbi:glycosyltransferase family 8 protein [Scleroderma yunnanense]